MPIKIYYSRQDHDPKTWISAQFSRLMSCLVSPKIYYKIDRMNRIPPQPSDLISQIGCNLECKETIPPSGLDMELLRISMRYSKEVKG